MAWLTSPAGERMLTHLGAYADSDAIALVTRLRRDGLSAEQAAAVVTQQELRTRARAKFAEQAAGMLFTPEGLEQATRAEVAAVHAARFMAAGVERVHDLGCGIGADARAFAAAGLAVAAIDADPVTAAVAAANLRPWPAARAEVGRVEDAHLEVTGSGAWLDPGRRESGIRDARGRARRVTGLAQLRPSWEQVCAVAARLPATGAKLAPAFPHNEIPPSAEAQWVSWSGDLVECAIWYWPLAATPGRTALILRPDRPAVTVTQADAPEPSPALSGLAGLGPWLYEVDKAIVQARLTAAVTTATDGSELEAGVGYVSGHAAYDIGAARRYRVVDAMPHKPARLRMWLRERGITGVTIKQRGAGVEEGELRRQLRVGRGAGNGAQAVVVLTPVAGALAAIVVEPA